MSRPKIVALIVAAGRGARMGGDTPKQYRALGGETVLRRTLRRMLSHPAIDAARVAIAPEARALYDDALAGFDDPRLGPPIPGGAERQDSVRAGLIALRGETPEDAPDIVLIHDAARPFAPDAVIDAALAALGDAAVQGALPGLPVFDTLHRGAKAGASLGSVDRDDFWRAQTPQVFRFGAILDAHERAAAAGRIFTDDADLGVWAGLTVRMTPGAADNIKLTTQEDFARAAQELENRVTTRIGQGFDVHAFGEGDHVTLCGVRVPHDRGLSGHSDADVGLHAVTDALLGAVAAGDIGRHFPPSDPQWRGADSALFLRRAIEIVAERGGAVVNVDVTLICETPKIGPHADAMRARIAEICGFDVDAVSVKATTSEQLGFTGRGEGIAAIAVALVSVDA